MRHIFQGILWSLTGLSLFGIIFCYLLDSPANRSISNISNMKDWIIEVFAEGLFKLVFGIFVVSVILLILTYVL